MKFFSYFSVVDFSNSYLIGPDEGGDAVLIDPSIFDAPLLRLIEDNGLYVRHVLITHAHNAHINGLKTLLKIYEAKIYGQQPSVLDFPTTPIMEGPPLRLGEFSVDVFETPGHSSDSLCYRVERLLFTGDTITAGGVGKTDSGYARALLLSSVRDKLLALHDETFVFPGHGPPSKIGIERAFNPYLVETL
jgi:hydroxyacylglutathione hydrolase